MRATILDFSQDGYDERSEFFESNKLAWGEVLQNLKQVMESQLTNQRLVRIRWRRNAEPNSRRSCGH
jgi:hypothetical protein